MSKLSSLFLSINQKIQVLINHTLVLQEQCITLEAKNKELLETIDRQADKICLLEEEIKTNAVVNNTEFEGSSEMKKKIDELVRDIDKCIASLNK